MNFINVVTSIFEELLAIGSPINMANEMVRKVIGRAVARILDELATTKKLIQIERGENLAELAKDEDYDVRCAAVAQNGSCVHLLENLRQDELLIVRHEAKLVQIKNGENLSELAKDENEVIRRAAKLALVAQGKNLEALSEDWDSSIREAALEALERVKMS